MQRATRPSTSHGGRRIGKLVSQFPSFAILGASEVSVGRWDVGDLQLRGVPFQAFVQADRDIAQADGYLTSWTQTLNSDGIAVSRAFDRGAVVTAIVGATIGETAILGLHAYAPDSVVGIEAGSRVLPEFIEYILRFWKPIFRAKAPETARANINLETLRPLTVPVPPLDDQQRFAQMYARVKQLDKAVPLADDLFNSLSQRAFRGEV